MSINVQTWDGNNINDGTNYITGFATPITGLPPAEVQLALRNGRHPLVTGVVRPGYMLMLDTIVVAATAAKREQLRQWFDYEDETPKQLVIQGDDGNTQYIFAVVEAHYEAPSSAGIGNNFMTLLRVHDDPAWRKSSATTPSNWGITASGQTRAYTNAGEKDAYPVISITPTSAKSGTNQYKRFFAVQWRGDAVTGYPVDIGADSLDTRVSSTNFSSTAGNDIRVYVNGQRVSYWLDGINTATTKVWINLNFKKGQEATLASALGTGTIETIDVNEDISGWGESGIIWIDSELFVYSAKNNSLKRFFIESRGAKGTSVASHSAAATARWIQHNIVLTYGTLTTANVNNEDKKPIINLASSTNTSFVYADFGEDDGLRTASWQKGVELDSWSVNYTANQDSDADPWSEIGIKRSRVDLALNPYFYVYNPCEITNANFQNGQKYAGFGEAQWKGQIVSGINGPNEYLEASIAAPSAAATWQAWSQNEALRSGSKYVGIRLVDTSGGGGTDMKMEAADVTLTLNSSNTPNILPGPEQGNYNLAATLTNNSLEEAITVNFQMETNETLVIDTYNGTVTYDKDGSSQYAAVERVGGPRLAWMRLRPGSNTWQFDDAGTAGVTVSISYEERYGA